MGERERPDVKLRPDGKPYQCPYNLNLVATIVIEWPCPSCGAGFADYRNCLDRVPLIPRRALQEDTNR
jgi:hypothetical protein